MSSPDKSKQMHKAVFLDKDGTLIEDVPYNADPGKIRFTRGSTEGLRLLQKCGYRLIVVTNQAGIAKGLVTVPDLQVMRARLFELSEAAGVRLSGFFFCPHHPEGTVEQYRVSCDCRKPEPGLILRAAREHSIDLTASWLVGDILHDIEAGRRAGCRTILIDNGNETEWVIAPLRVPDHIVSDLQEAAEIICKENGAPYNS